MSYERPDPERGAYTPRTDDDLPFDRSGFDARGGRGGRGGGGGGGGPPPMTLIISAIVLLVLIVAVILYFRSGVRGEGEAPPVVGGEGVQAGAAPADAQPLTPEAEIELYDPTDEMVELAPPPEQPGAPPPLDQTPTPSQPTPQPPVTPTPRPTPPQPQPRPTPPPAQPTPRPSTPPVAAGAASVQIGAFSSQEAAERAYAEVAAAFPQFASGRTRGIQRITTSEGRTVYRTTVNGFGAQDARAFCGALRAAGRDCLVQ